MEKQSEKMEEQTDVFVLEGSVGSGKTFLYKSLKETLKKKNIQVTCLEEPEFNEYNLNGRIINPLAELYKDKVAGDTFLCMQILICQILSNFYETKKINNRVILLDRWIKSCDIFHEMGHKNGLLENPSLVFLQDFVKYKQEKFLNSIPGRKKIHLFFLNTDHEKCANQVFLRKRSEETKKSVDFWVQFSKDFKDIALKQNVYEKIDSFENLKSYITEQILLIKKNSNKNSLCNPDAEIQNKEVSQRKSPESKSS